jgi:tripartite-type tricarboxylate transporter receptor subunit TctC
MPIRTVRQAAASAFVAAALAFSAMAAPASAEYPERPITIIVAYGPGGMTDVTTRILSEKLEDILGVDILVENRPGAGGTLAWGTLLEQPADGYTIVSFGTSEYVTTIMLERDYKIDDFAVLGSYMPQQRVLFARKEMPFTTMEGMMEYAKENPVTFADGGLYWASRVMEALAKKNDLAIRLVPFRSGAEGSAAILGGHVSIAETGVGTGAWLGATREGTLNILGVLSPGNLDEVGQPGHESIEAVGADFLTKVYYGYAMKAGTDPAIIDKLSSAFEEALSDPEVQARFRDRDLIPQWMPPGEYAEVMSSLAGEAQALKEFLAD